MNFFQKLINQVTCYAQAEVPSPLKEKTFEELVDRIAGYLILIAAPICTIMVLWGAFQILTAAGSPDKIKQGKQTITYAAIGFAIVLIAKGITLIIKELLGVEAPSVPTSPEGIWL